MAEQTTSTETSWTWRGSATNRAGKAHLIPDFTVNSSNPRTLCGKRMRKPIPTYPGLCPECWLQADTVPHDQPNFAQ